LLLDNMARGLESYDLRTMSETEIENFLSEYQLVGTQLSLSSREI
jgi:hypothetical protein